MNRSGRTKRPYEVDFSEVAGRSYKCVDGCALCCLCQPELLPEEETMFRAEPSLSGGVAERHISPDVRGAAIKLRGDHGACYFLQNRRCRAYAARPHFCRSFPVNVFVGWRVQMNANLSCRGLDQAGEDLEALANGILSEYGEARVASEVKDATKVFTEFVRNCRDSWVAQSFSSVREAGTALLDELVDRVGLSRVLTYAEQGTAAQNTPARDIARQARRTEPEADIEQRALVDGTELFDLPDLSLLPIYIDEHLTWRIFKLVGKEIVGYELSEDGSTRETSRTDPLEIELLPLSASGRDRVKEYMGTVINRDCFLGHAAYLCDSEGYEFNFGQAYLGALATNALDLWWRTSFLAALEGKEELGTREVREGIVFFDMDLLDLPTIGAFI